MLKRGVTLGELLTAFIAVIGAILGFWINTNVRISALEINQAFTKENVQDTRATLKEISEKLDNLNQGQNEIKITLQNKADRK